MVQPGNLCRLAGCLSRQVEERAEFTKKRGGRRVSQPGRVKLLFVPDFAKKPSTSELNSSGISQYRE